MGIGLELGWNRFESRVELEKAKYKQIQIINFSIPPKRENKELYFSESLSMFEPGA